jgi:DNA-binding NarL/FixJ family response regulator
MNKLIIIIHSSEIIRKGLAAIIRSFFSVEILQLENLHDLHSYQKMKNHSLVIILQNTGQNNNDLLQTLQKYNQVKLIEFYSPDTNKHPLPVDSIQAVNPDTSALEIQEIISNCWKSAEKTSRMLENDELTYREKEVLRLVALGYSNKIIADKLFISIHTVISHRKNISEKTGIKSISGLTVYAILNNFIDTNSINPGDLI